MGFSFVKVKGEKIVREMQNERSENGGRSGVFTVETER